MCACTLMRRSVIIRCEDFDSNCVSENDVTPCTSVAQTTARMIGIRSCRWCLPITLSIRNFVEPGRTRPATRLISISPKPSARIALRGSISSHTSGRSFHAPFDFSGLLRPRGPRSASIRRFSPVPWLLNLVAHPFHYTLMLATRRLTQRLSTESLLRSLCARC